MRVISISTSGDFVKADRVLQRLKKQLPAMTIKAMIQWGKILEKDMKNVVRQTSSKSTGMSQKEGIEWRQGKRSNVGYLFMRQYLLALDHADPHFVNITRRITRLLAWAKKSRKFRRKARMVESRKLDKFSIYVRPHPFISTGYKRARPKLRPIHNRSIKQAIAAA